MDHVELADFGSFLLKGGFLLEALYLWFIFSRQRDVLETGETAIRILVGTLLVLIQLASYSFFTITLYIYFLDSEPWSNYQWAIFCLSVVYMLPSIVSILCVAFYPVLFKRRWRLRRLHGDEPVLKTLDELSERIGLFRTIDIYEAATLMPSPIVFQFPFSRPMLVLPLDWEHWGAQYAQERQAVAAVRRFVLLHELSHMRNGDVFFMTWAGMFLLGYRFWAPIVLLVQFIVITMGLKWLDGALYLVVYPTINAITTMVIYPIFQLLYLSVSRERELLADGRALLYLASEDQKFLCQQSILFNKKAASQSFERKSVNSRPRRWQKTFSDFLRLISRGWSPLSVMPVVETNRKFTSFFETHPSGDERFCAILDRSVIQRQIGEVSSGTACWVGIVVGIFTIQIFPFLWGITAFISISNMVDMLTWWALFFMLYPTLAFCLPFRNALSYTHPLSMQIRQLIGRFLLAGLCFLGILSVGYLYMMFAFSLIGWETRWGPIFFESYFNYLILGLIFSPILSVTILAFMNFLFRIIDRQNRLAVFWSSAMTLIMASALFALVSHIQFTEWAHSYTLVVIITMGSAVIIGKMTLGRLIVGSIDFPQCTISVYWAGRLPRIWHKELDSKIAHLLWSTLTAMGILGLIAFLPAWVVKFGLDKLYSVAPFSVESFWGQLALFSLFLTFVFFTFSHSDKLSTKLVVGIDRRNAYIQDIDRLVQVGSVLDLNPAKHSKDIQERFPAELLTNPIDASHGQGWILGMPLEVVDRSTRLAAWHSGAQVLSSVVLKHVENCACTGGGFGLWPGGMPRLGSTFHALNILGRVGHLHRINGDEHERWILSCEDREGGFRSPQQASVSLQDTYHAIRSCDWLGCLEKLNGDRCANCVKRLWLHSERTMEQTRFAVASLAILNMLTPDFIALLECSWLPRYRSFVLSMRVDKQIDHVWNYVQIVSSLFDSSSAAYSTWMDGLLENVSEGWKAFFGAAV
ncbi:MAG: M48 family metalloprotease [Anaerolineales bacterium]|nr:M48 family metalloprotease [Anaerolineales bacterium]